MEKEAKKHFLDCEGAETRATPRFRDASERLSILIFLGGGAVLAGWALDIPALKSIFPGFVTMKANTALVFVSAGISLWALQQKRREDAFFQKLGGLSALIVFGLGLLTFFEYVFGWNFGIDQLLFKELPGAILTSSPGRMAFNTAINFTITGLALFLLASSTRNRCFFVQLLMLPVGILSALSFIGYLYHADPVIIGLEFSTAMALHTTVLFLAVFFGLFCCRPGCGLMTVVSSDSTGGKMVRRLIPLTILVPLSLGWLKLYWEKIGFGDPAFGVSFVATGNLTILSLSVYILAYVLNKSEAERKKAEEEIKKLNSELEERVKRRTAELAIALKELEAFSYSVAHDLKAPLRAMGGFANILSEDYAPKLDENGRRVIGVIDANVKNMGQMIDDLLKLSHTGRQEMSFADIDMQKLAQSVCREVKEELYRDRDIEVSIKPMPPARGDLVLANQIFLNLISNAMKFTSLKEKAEIEIGGFDKDGERVYYVKDNGAGFDMKYINKLFETFQRLHAKDKFEGTGIGLAIVKSAVQRHGGRVWAEGEVGQGATFYFTLLKGG